MTNSTDAMLYTTPIRYEDDDNICFATTATPSTATLAALAAKLDELSAIEPSAYRMMTLRIAAIDKSAKGGKFKVQTSAE